jgi:hypothetical protein
MWHGITAASFDAAVDRLKLRQGCSFTPPPTSPLGFALFFCVSFCFAFIDTLRFPLLQLLRWSH